MTPSREELIVALEQTPPALVGLTSWLSEQALDFRPGHDAWSIREILAHLVDDEMYVMRTRLERFVAEEQPLLAPHDEKQWYANRNTSRDQIAELLGDFALQRAASVGIMKMLRESDWQRRGEQPEYGIFSAEEWLTKWVAHDQTHLRQIEDNVQEYQNQYPVG
jgi:DinB superfamily